MRTLKLMVLGTLVICTTGATAAESAAPAGFEWLVGQWCMESGGDFIEELWLPPRADMMLGLGRTIRNGKTANFEFLRIEQDAGVTQFIAQPQGGAPTAFRLTAWGANWARFENATHDFPKRVEYRRTSEGLHAEVAGPGKGDKELVIPFEYRACD